MNLPFVLQIESFHLQKIKQSNAGSCLFCTQLLWKVQLLKPKLNPQVLFIDK